MHEYINSIDWGQYKLPGEEAPDILPLIQGILSEDFNTADQSAVDLMVELEEALVIGNDLLFVVIPVLIAALDSSSVIHKAVFIGMLTELASFTYDPNSSKVKGKYKRLREEICKGTNTYQNLLASLSDLNSLQNIKYLLRICSQVAD